MTLMVGMAFSSLSASVLGARVASRSSDDTMTTRRDASSPPPLHLSTQEADALEDVAEQVMQQTLTDYLRFRDVQKRRLHPEQWKEVRRYDNLVAFKERDAWRQQHQSLRTPYGVAEPVLSKASVPTILVLGALQGTLDDEMYGMHIDSDTAVRLRSSYIHDKLHDFRLLARIRGASKRDPFRFCGVSWANLGSGYPFARKRDCCVVTSMGSTRTPQGERVGYYVVHSVDAEVSTATTPTERGTQLNPDFRTNGSTNTSVGGKTQPRKYVRAKISLCWIKCELPAGRVELYMQGFFAPMSSAPEFAVVRSVLDSVVGLAQTSDTAYSKKLRWMLRDSMRATRRLAPPVTDDCVGRCSQQLKKKKFGCCIVCRALVCGSCHTTRKIAVSVEEDGTVQQTPCCICLLCMSYAKQVSARVFAGREMAHARARSRRVHSAGLATFEYIL